MVELVPDLGIPCRSCARPISPSADGSDSTKRMILIGHARDASRPVLASDYPR